VLCCGGHDVGCVCGIRSSCVCCTV
jgi:hypothetical protein